MYEIVCLLDMLDYLKTHIYFYIKILIFFLLDVRSIHFDIAFGPLSHGLNKKIHIVYSGTIPDVHINLVLHLRMKNKELNVHVQHNICPHLTIFVHFFFQKKKTKKNTHTLT